MKNLKEFAHYLRKNYLRAYVVESLRMINTMHIPMMKLFAHLSEEELISISLLSSEKFLVSLEDGTALEKAKESLQKWEADSLPGISKYDIQSADLLLVYAAQKKSLYHFLHFFTTDSAEQISIVYELEDYFTRVQEVAISLLLKIQKEKEEQIQTLNTHLGLRNFELAESEKKFYSIFHSSSIGMTISKLSDKKFIEVNKKFLGSIGLEKKDVIGKTSLELGIIADTRKFNEVMKAENDKLVIPDFELTLITKSGKQINALVSLTVMEIDGEQCVVSLFYDITDKKRIEMELQKNSEALMRSNKELEQFAYIASHDLQEPLRTVTNYVGLLQRKYRGRFDKNADDFLDFINSGTERMQLLIKALLEYSRIGNNRIALEIDCNLMLEEVNKDIAISIKESKCIITNEPLPVLIGYAELKSVFQNLIGNAIKYRKKNTIPLILISVKDTPDEWVFSIEDNGIGIEAEYYERIFIIFQKLHSQKEYEGTGIGLSQCKKIVELHGGKIWLKSELEKGSTFYFTISKTIQK